MIKVEASRGGHGGGDTRLQDKIFRDPGMADPYKHSAGTRDGAMSCLIGIAARKSVDEHRPVKIEDLTGTESILIVDDVDVQREVACNMLSKLGYKVISASSGEEAVEYLKERSVDLLLLDMIMGTGMDGLETYKRILEIHPDQKSLIVSGFAETERVTEAQRLAAGAYIRKPFMLESLGMAIRNELDG